MVAEDQDDLTVQPAVDDATTTSSRLQRQSTQEFLSTMPKELRNLVAGGLAGMVAKSVVAPIDRIKILYQVSSTKFHIVDVPRVAYKIAKKEGLSALWKGNTATMIRVFPYSGLQFMVFDRCKSFFLKEHEREEVARVAQLQEGSSPLRQKRREWGLSPMESLISGALAGVCSAFCTYPLDMTRAQLAVMKKNKHAHNDGFVQVLVKNYKASVRTYYNVVLVVVSCFWGCDTKGAWWCISIP